MNRDLAAYQSAVTESDGSIVVKCGHFKTVDRFKEDMVVISQELRPLIQFYLENIRPKLLSLHNRTKHKHKPTIQLLHSEKALLLSHRGLRFTKFEAFPKIF